jgi:3-isopropylmalate/(R)-2-methylmalate dehydratase small subunit
MTTGEKLTFGKLPSVMLKFLDEGGLIPYVKKYGDLQIK